ncbi:hypothetical protein SD70_11410 [Gordoniibacillus kamchatkensis]|uniref:Uncharacterized protein n=1 Tax=Gordoniibacillus kamchatkensis TaxID=1590651 RepID=A0ABR5AKD4_9BACL|nr:hypothetical protein [Paenibacillus sp. VKM B-2647]KIL40827.1 hypothetical protein SD70_11410 [Paenibacillus sp. VKM B-2647]
MHKRPGTVMLRFAAVYSLALLIGTLLLTINNLVQYQWDLGGLWAFHLKAVLAGDLVFLLLLLGVTYRRMNVALRYFRGDRAVSSRDAFARMQKFPFEIFGGMLVLAFLLSILYHALALWHDETAIKELDVLLAVGGQLLSEMGIAATLAIMLFSAIRGVLRPYCLQLQIAEPESGGTSSILSALILTFVSCFFIAAAQITQYGISSVIGNGRSLRARFSVCRERTAHSLSLFFVCRYGSSGAI